MQLQLWTEQETPPEEARWIEVHYADGRRCILDTTNPADQEAFRDRSVIYAGFVHQKAVGRRN